MAAHGESITVGSDDEILASPPRKKHLPDREPYDPQFEVRTQQAMRNSLESGRGGPTTESVADHDMRVAANLSASSSRPNNDFDDDGFPTDAFPEDSDH